ncbi:MULTISPECIES: SoxY-related AACIE arm protein [unclassified Duganella]|uniref:SoxY-related AACIE arm protein n=1 Tax=unclassified Duganella TaxID=2636909 RepID=UPI0008847537|nr:MULTISPECIES: SoxY-related AACIE arm protein [unclassified Duganella]SDH49634.1 sulfur-oxidizing protein SoxY [Duganella sp. OV458]SDK63783.1 sulfur-oxidizing protein SoxY [Duganella sp. OV510]
MKRRDALAAGAGLAMLALVRPASATPAEMAAAINTFTGGAKPQTGKVTFDIAQLIDNGNAVPVTISVDSPVENLKAIAIFTERNPQTEVAIFTLTPRSGKAQVSTRIRLATSQRLVAVARMGDGSYWSHQVEVIVALAACVEGEIQ